VVALLASVALKTPVTTNCSSFRVGSLSFSSSVAAAFAGGRVAGAGAVWAGRRAGRKERDERLRLRARERGSRGMGW
jgi:hypothetical protein